MSAYPTAPVNSNIEAVTKRFSRIPRWITQKINALKERIRHDLAQGKGPSTLEVIRILGIVWFFCSLVRPHKPASPLCLQRKKLMTDASKFITFVLGAGASFEVGMPTGYELKAKIASSLSFKVDVFGRLGGGDDQLREALHQISQRQGSEVIRGGHLSAANLIHAGMRQAPSIDNFIDSHRSNPRVAEVGKLAIASEILKAERASKLYVSPTNIYNKLKFEAVEHTWFDAFFQLLTLNAQEQDLPERLKQVQVVTFNYDRTLEHYLFHSIQNYYGCSPAKSAEILANLVPTGIVVNIGKHRISRKIGFNGKFITYEHA